MGLLVFNSADDGHLQLGVFWIFCKDSLIFFLTLAMDHSPIYPYIYIPIYIGFISLEEAFYTVTQGRYPCPLITNINHLGSDLEMTF